MVIPEFFQEILDSHFSDETFESHSAMYDASDKAIREIIEQTDMYTSRPYFESFIDSHPELWEDVMWYLKSCITVALDNYKSDLKNGFKPDAPISGNRVISAFVDSEAVLERVKSFVANHITETYRKQRRELIAEAK